MQSKSVEGIRLFFAEDQARAAELCADACAKSIPLIREVWGLEVPRDCRVYVMTSWPRFLFQAAGWPNGLAVALALPLLYFRIRKQWPVIAGWTYRFYRRAVVGVKPPALLAKADTRLGALIYVREPDLGRKLQTTLCHELVHAFSAALRLPLWLNEGIAMLSVDRYAGVQTVKPNTISPASNANYRNLMRQGADGIAYNYLRAYWLVRFLEECQPGLIRSLLVKRQRAREIEAQVSRAVGLEPGRFWIEINGKISAHFAGREMPAAIE